MQKFIIEEVRTIEEVRRGTTHKVRSRKSAGRIDPLQASVGGIFYTQQFVYESLQLADSMITIIECETHRLLHIDIFLKISIHEGSFTFICQIL